MPANEIGFVLPGRDQRRFDVLNQIRADSTHSQHAIAAKIGLSAAAVNRYINELINEGLVQTRGNSIKTTQYFLTPDGETTLSELTKGRNACLLQQSYELRDTIADTLRMWLRAKYQGVVVAGADFRGGLVCVVAEVVGLPVLALVDFDTQRHGDRFLGYVVHTPSVLEVGKWQPCGLFSLGADAAAEHHLRTLAINAKLEYVAM